MKRIFNILLPVLFLIFTILSCDTSDQPEPDFISARINDENWKGLPEIKMSNVSDTLTLFGSDNDQVVVFKIKFVGEGIYNLSGTQAIYYTTIGGDVITSSYLLEDNATSQITITEYNSEQDFIMGNFEITLRKEWSNPENNNDLLKFTNGRFKGSIPN